MNLKDLDPELLESMANVGGHYGRKIEECMERILRLKRVEVYLKKRIFREWKPQPLTVRMIVKIRKEIGNTKEEALRYRHYLIIYRESLGLINHRNVFEIYNIEKIC